MKLVFAQGNPGTEYHRTRHNVGFALLEQYATRVSANFTTKSKFQAEIAECVHASEKILLVKPATYYNDTGIAARALVDFYKLTPATDVLVLHDDLMLPLGTIRTRERGSDAGNNGVKSLNSHLGEQYKRTRIGIWTELADRMDATAFVLGKFTAEEQDLLAVQQPTLLRIIGEFIEGKFSATSYTQ